MCFVGDMLLPPADSVGTEVGPAAVEADAAFRSDVTAVSAMVMAITGVLVMEETGRQLSGVGRGWWAVKGGKQVGKADQAGSQQRWRRRRRARGKRAD